jgi:hypothetical protein
VEQQYIAAVKSFITLAPGEKISKNICLKQAKSGSRTVVQYSSHNPNIEGSSPGTGVDTRILKMPKYSFKFVFKQASSSFIVVEHLPRQLGVKGLSLAIATGTKERKWKKK